MKKFLVFVKSSDRRSGQEKEKLVISSPMKEDELREYLYKEATAELEELERIQNFISSPRGMFSPKGDRFSLISEVGTVETTVIPWKDVVMR